MPPRSLRARLLLLFVGSVAAVAVLVVAVAVRQTSHDQRTASERNLRTQAIAVTELLAKRQENDLGTFGQGEFFLPTLQRVTNATRFLYAPYQQLPPPTKIDLGALPDLCTLAEEFEIEDRVVIDLVDVAVVGKHVPRRP